jgi:hypothetical protein
MNMTEPNESDKKDEAAEPIEDEPIIDPKDETVEAGTDAMAVDEAAATSEEALKGDEEIIDLLQAVEEPSAKDPDKTVSEEAPEPIEDEAPIVLEEEVTDDTGDEIIDLLDAAEEIPITEDTEKRVDEVTEPVEDEAAIDLIESVDDTALEIEEIGEPIPDVTDTAQEFEDISELDDDLIKEVTDSMDGSDSETIVNGALKPDFTDSLGIELGSEEDAKENLFDPDKVSNEQIDAALERVIKKMFYEKIDRLLVDTIEKTVTKEIEKLKKALLDDVTGSE